MLHTTDNQNHQVKKVALFADYLSGLGGTEYYIVQLATLLKRKGVDVRIFTGVRPNNDYWLKILHKQNIKVFSSNYKYADRLDRNPEEKYVDQVSKIFDIWKPNIIHASPLGKLALAWIGSNLHKEIPIIGTEITTPSSDTEHWYWPDIKDKINKFSAIVATCNESAKGIKNFLKYDGVIFVLPHFIPEPAKKFQQRLNTSNSIGCICRLSPEKGVDFLIASMLKVVKTSPKTTLHIYGHGKDLERTDNLIKSLSLQKNVFLEGTYEPITGIEDLASKHSIFVQPSLFESIPTSILELLARKRVIIATKVGGIPELFDGSNAAVLVDRADTCQLSDAIIKVLEDNTLRKTLSQNGYDLFVKKYNNQESLDKYLNAYTQVISS